MRHTPLLVALAALTALPLMAQAAGPRALAAAGVGSFTIDGFVVSATTGTPLDRSDVSLFAPGQRGSQIATTVTAENGAFRFDGLQAGKYRLEASRRGYITGGYQDHDGFSTAIVTGPNFDSGNLRLTLRPAAIIDGTITDDAGDPIGGAQVHLYRQDQRNGETRILPADQSVTDDLGTYEFARLRAGTYYVGVSASPWYAFHPPRKTDASGNPLPDDQQPHSPLDVAYAMTFYETATDSASATPIPLNAGDRVEADLSMHAVPAIHIQVHVPQPEAGRGLAIPQLMQDVFGSEQYQPSGATSFVRNQGGDFTADLAGVAPGHYVLRQFAPPGDASRTASVDLTSDQTVDFSAASTSGVDVTGKVVMANGARLPTRTFVTLVPTNGGPGLPEIRVDANGGFAIHGVAPGGYEFQVHATGATLAVAQMAASGAQFEGSHITVAAEPVLLAATLATGSTSINGFARQDGKGVGGAMILLVPRDPNASHELYRRDQSDSDGSFTLNRVVPGNYTLVAIEDGWTLDWARPEVITPYLTHGLNVRVAGQKTLDLPTAVEVVRR
jgi:hypothetical protein